MPALQRTGMVWPRDTVRMPVFLLPSFFSVMSPPQAISSAVEDIPKCSVMLATGPDMAAAETVKSIRERWNVRFEGAVVYFELKMRILLFPIFARCSRKLPGARRTPHAQEPVVMFTDNIADRMALERADLGCCMYTATGGLLQVCTHVSDVERVPGSLAKSLAMAD